jgi:hypothetical protein
MGAFSNHWNRHRLLIHPGGTEIAEKSEDRVIARTASEARRDEAIQRLAALDCFASLATTARR